MRRSLTLVSASETLPGTQSPALPSPVPFRASRVRFLGEREKFDDLGSERPELPQRLTN